jgi:Dioxygenase
MLFLKRLCCFLLFACISLAHPGHDVAEEAAERAEFLRRNPRTVRSCASKLKARGHEDAGVQRRQAVYESLLTKRNLPPKTLTNRDFATYNFSHFSSDATINYTTRPAVLFGDDSSCMLQPDVTQGPYYVNGELIRENVAEGQGGIPLFLQMQFVDTSTCEPIPNMWVDLWHCNATGVYSGVVANGNGNSNDTSNLDATFLRGINLTNSAGVAHFQTIFPGHYLGKFILADGEPY